MVGNPTEHIWRLFVKLAFDLDLSPRCCSYARTEAATAAAGTRRQRQRPQRSFGVHNNGAQTQNDNNECGADKRDLSVPAPSLGASAPPSLSPSSLVIIDYCIIIIIFIIVCRWL